MGWDGRTILYNSNILIFILNQTSTWWCTVLSILLFPVSMLLLLSCRERSSHFLNQTTYLHRLIDSNLSYRRSWQPDHLSPIGKH
jgi:hypothetical protein